MTDELVKTTVPGLLVDKKTGLIVNTKQDDLMLYRNKIAQAKEMKALKDRIRTLENEVQGIKANLTQLSGKKKSPNGRNRKSG